jgi:hypothetical protein
MKVTIKGILKESKEDVIEKISKSLEKPYFKDLINMDIPKGLWKDIFSNLFNQKVIVDTINYEGYSVVDKNSEIIYFETDNGAWQIYEHNEYGNLIYYYNSKGEWARREFDEYGKLIYFINDKGQVIDRRPNRNINESTEVKNSYYKKIIPLLKKPYMVDFNNFNIPMSDWGDIFRMIYGWRITIHMSESIFTETPQYVQIYLEIPYTNKKLMVYYEDAYGDWVEKEYDSKTGQLIGFEDDEGKSYVTESVDRKEKFYDYIVKTMLDDTEYEILDKNYGGTVTEKIIAIKFPMYPWEEYTYKSWNIHTWLHFDGWKIGALDIDYVVNNFGVDENLGEVIFKKYIKELAKEITEKMPF